MASAVNPVAGAAVTEGASPAPAGSQGTPAVNLPASPAGPGSDGASPASSPAESHGMRQLREQYETTKGELSQWSQLGKREEVASSHQAYVQQRNAVLDLGRELGYTDDDILASFRDDPIGTYRVLFTRQAELEQNPNQPPPDINKAIKQALERELKPFRDEQEKAAVQKTSNICDSEFERCMKEDYPDGLPDDTASLLYDMAFEMLSYDKDAMSRIKGQGKVADFTAYYKKANERLLKAFTAWGSHQQKRAGKPGQSAAPPNASNFKKPTLQEMIDGSYDFGYGKPA